MAGASAVTSFEAANRVDPIGAIADFMRGFSLEATRPSAEDVAALAGVTPAGARVYVSAVPTRAPEEAIEAATRLRAADSSRCRIWRCATSQAARRSMAFSPA